MKRILTLSLIFIISLLFSSCLQIIEEDKTNTNNEIVEIQAPANEFWIPGHTYEIQWKSHDIQKVKIDIYGKKILSDGSIDSDISKVSTAIEEAEDSGSYLWTIPVDFVEQYKGSFDKDSFYIVITDTQEGVSERLHVSEKPITIDTPYITLSSINEKSVMKAGSLQTINYSYYGNEFNANIELYKGDEYYSTIAENVYFDKEGTGSISWTLPDDIYADKTYNIRIKDSISNMNYDKDRSNFLVVPSINVLSPNESETLKLGDTYNIKWESKGKGFDKVLIMLISKEVDGKSLMIGIADNSMGEYSWKIPYDKKYLDSNFGISVSPTGLNFIQENEIRLQEYSGFSNESISIEYTFKNIRHFTDFVYADNPDLTLDKHIFADRLERLKKNNYNFKNEANLIFYSYNLAIEYSDNNAIYIIDAGKSDKMEFKNNGFLITKKPDSDLFSVISFTETDEENKYIFNLFEVLFTNDQVKLIKKVDSYLFHDENDTIQDKSSLLINTSKSRRPSAEEITGNPINNTDPPLLIDPNITIVETIYNEEGELIYAEWIDEQAKYKFENGKYYRYYNYFINGEKYGTWKELSEEECWDLWADWVTNPINIGGTVSQEIVDLGIVITNILTIAIPVTNPLAVAIAAITLGGVWAHQSDIENAVNALYNSLNTEEAKRRYKMVLNVVSEFFSNYDYKQRTFLEQIICSFVYSAASISKEQLERLCVSVESIANHFNLSFEGLIALFATFSDPNAKKYPPESIEYQFRKLVEKLPLISQKLSETNIINISRYLNTSDHIPGKVMDAVIDIVSLIEKAPNENGKNLDVNGDIVEVVTGMIAKSPHDPNEVAVAVSLFTNTLTACGYKVSKDDIITTTQRICGAPTVGSGLEGAVRDFIETHNYENSQIDAGDETETADDNDDLDAGDTTTSTTTTPTTPVTEDTTTTTSTTTTEETPTTEETETAEETEDTGCISCTIVD